MMTKDEKKNQTKAEKAQFKDATPKAALKAALKTPALKLHSVKASDVSDIPAWAVMPRNKVVPVAAPKFTPPISVATDAKAARVDGALKAMDTPGFKHRLWAVMAATKDNLQALMRDEGHKLAEKYVLAPDKTDCTMAVTEGEWTKVLEGGIPSFFARCIGCPLAHMDFIGDPLCKHTPVHFLPLTNGQRLTTLRIFMSDACVSKHQTFTAELNWLAELKPIPPYVRYKFELINGGDAQSFLNRLKGCSTTQQANSHRWLVTKDELTSAVGAVASTIAIAPSAVKIVMQVHTFVSQLGKCREVIH